MTLAGSFLAACAVAAVVFAFTPRSAVLRRLAILAPRPSQAAIALIAPRDLELSGAGWTGPQLLAAGLASLALGLYPYGALLLFARASYALGDSRTPAIVAITSSIAGVLVMIVGSRMTHGAARVAVLGVGHTAAYLLGAIVLGVVLSRRTGHLLVPRHLVPASACAIPLAVIGWAIMRGLAPEGRVAIVLVLGLVVAVGALCYTLAVRRWVRPAPAANGLVKA